MTTTKDGRRPKKNENGRRPQQNKNYMEDEPINQNQSNWL